MPLHLMGPNPLHLDLVQGTLVTAGWRAADIHVQADLGALEQALQAQPQATLILDLGPTTEAAELDGLAEVTRRWPLLRVLVLSGQRSEALLLQAMRSGVREVLDSPPEPADLTEALQRLQSGVAVTAAASERPPEAGTVLAFVASKGGSGSTMLATSLAWLLAAEFGRDCLFVDLDLLYGDASFYLGGGSARHSLADLMRQGPRLDAQLLRSSLHPVHEHLHLLAAPAQPALGAPLPAEVLARVLALARERHQVVVLDVPRHLDEMALQALRLADQVFVVMRKRVPDVRNAQRLLRLLREQGMSSRRLHPLLNRHTEEGGLDRTAIDQAIDPPLAHLVSNDPSALQACVHLGVPLHEQAPGSPALRDLRQLASTTLDLPMPRRKGWLGRWIGQAE